MFIGSPVSAQVKLRGFQVGVEEITPSLVDELAAVWKVNLIRVQVGNNSLMDSRTGQGYIAMMEEAFARVDQVLPLFAARNIKVVFALYSPPGGFQTRESPAHYRMFSQAGLQAEFISMWLRIMGRYKDNPVIYAFDLVNEPALRKNLRGAGVKDWNGLLLETIGEIRKVAPKVKLVVKSLYGDPFKLGQLPPIRDKNIIYSYHPYLYRGYQHSGIGNTPTNLKQPTAAQIKKKLLEVLAKFVFKQKQRKDKKQIRSLPVINAGEVAISVCAPGGAQYLSNILGVIERDDLKKAKKRAKARARAARKANGGRETFRDYINKVKHNSYTIHAFAEASVWDPRYVCSGKNSNVFSGNLTDRAIVLQSYFSRNR